MWHVCVLGHVVLCCGVCAHLLSRGALVEAHALHPAHLVVNWLITTTRRIGYPRARVCIRVCMCVSSRVGPRPGTPGESLIHSHDTPQSVNLALMCLHVRVFVCACVCHQSRGCAFVCMCLWCCVYVRVLCVLPAACSTNPPGRTRVLMCVCMCVYVCAISLYTCVCHQSRGCAFVCMCLWCCVYVRVLFCVIACNTHPPGRTRAARV